MNKRFSTLLATALVACGMSASAQNAGEYLKANDLKTGDYVFLSNPAGTNDDLAVTPEGVLKLHSQITSVAAADTTIALLDSMAWKVTKIAGTVPTFKFQNKVTGHYLSVKALGGQGEAKIDGGIDTWAVDGTHGVYAVSGDSAYYLDVTSSQIVVTPVAGTVISSHSFQPRAMNNKITLSAAEFNTFIKGFKFNALNGRANDPTDVTAGETNILTKESWVARPIHGNFGADVEDHAAGTHMDMTCDTVFFQLKSSYDAKKDSVHYLSLDTAYLKGTVLANASYFFAGADSLKKADQSTKYMKDGKWVVAKNDSLYMFTVEYTYKNDSIAIHPIAIPVKLPAADGTTGSEWATTTAATPEVERPSNANGFIVGLRSLSNAVALAVDKVSGANNGFTHANVNASGSATPSKDNKSKDNGLYVIYNAKGQVLASPIHKNGTAFEWVTLDAQDPQHMPAYQWFIQKTQYGANLAETSPLKLTNREFNQTSDAIQLVEKDGKIVIAGDLKIGSTTLADAETALNFVQITDSTILKDKYLGYKKFDKDSLTIAQYKFNYLHKFEKNSWIKKGEGKDSVLYAVKDDYTPFVITEGVADATYATTIPAGDGFKGIAKLVRTQYMISVKTDSVGIGAEDRVVLGDVAKVDSFYFKENNEYDGKHYFAILDADKDSKAITNVKYSVSDAGVSAYMQSQPLSEATTSAFAILTDDAPLYRRFNTSLEGAVEGKEDSTKVLKFKEYYRGEYLMDENNEKFQNEGVDYLGIERADKATGLSFYVDTAILNSTKGGYIKPQYFIYLNPEIQPATPAVPCPLDHSHGVDVDGNPLDAYHCSHTEAAKPGYVKAQYLVSFADSLNVKNADKLYKFGEYTRVGFVDGLHIGDSLYILVNGFENMALADLDTAKIKAAYEAAKITDKIIDLKAERTDEHHNYTWSFRYVDPQAAASPLEEDRRFLIESDKGDKDIAPSLGAWLKSQNGCLVLSDATTSTFSDAKTGGDNALIFNIEMGSEDDMATDNETIATSEVAVIAQEGAVRIANAEGKKVVITNILGQVVANTVITSSDAVIAAPQGVVVVAVEGEEAVKAIVK
ncbi:DUF6383 domain-containing protein [uncultured Parabacteroides sp.]|uniref:DUF6383 domain-containing protein n=1 Tax=uncultured Parabacteroides sp. TaxID=512312 RepID=UPI0026E5519D|nr:DUF6383 domain-containing protein [uncultured Parabacteroides sp.]